MMLVATIMAVSGIACNGNHIARQLDIADSLSATNAPLAEKKLEQIKDSVNTLCEEEQVRWKLIKVKTDVYSFKKFTSDSLIYPVVKYYEQHNYDKSKLAQAYYYAGKVYGSMNDRPQAFKYFTKALDIIPPDEVNLKGRTYNQLGYIYTSQWLDENAIYMYMKADSCYLASGDTASCIYTQRDIACAYFDKKQKDSAYININNALKLAKRLQDKAMETDIYAIRIAMYSMDNKYNEAYKHLKPLLNVNKQPSNNNLLYAAARTYMGLGYKDSALIYYKKLINCTNIHFKQKAHKELAEYSIKSSKIQDALYHLNKYKIYTDSINLITSADVIQEKKNQYNYGLREKENIRLKKENEDKTFTITILSSSIIIISIIITFFITFRKLRKKYKLDKYNFLIEKISTIPSFIQPTQNKLEDCNIYKRIKLIINTPYEKKKLTDNEWKELDETINRIYPRFNEKLAELCKMSINDHHLCLLLKIGLSLSDIGNFINIGSSGVNSARRKLYKRAFKIEASAKSWDDVISSL